MTREEHLLTIIAEECVEIAKCATKALRFGLDDCEPGQPESNARRICLECADLQAVLEMLAASNCMFQLTGRSIDMDVVMAAKKAKVEKFLSYSAERGRLTE
jgi:hypothetical protein